MRVIRLILENWMGLKALDITPNEHIQKIEGANEQGKTSALAGIDLVLILADGQVQAFGPKDEVLRKSLAARPGSAASAPSSKLVVAADARG